MKRKRFKKLCMGCGFSRSMADNAAFTTWFCFGNYAEGWRMMEEALAAVKRAAEGAGGAVSGAGVGSAVSGAGVNRAAEGVGSAVSGAGVGPYGEEAAKCE